LTFKTQTEDPAKMSLHAFPFIFKVIETQIFTCIQRPGLS
jgi:hypothetical protein